MNSEHYVSFKHSTIRGSFRCLVVETETDRQTDRQTDANDICRVRVDYDAGFLINSMTNILVRMYNTHCRALKH